MLGLRADRGVRGVAARAATLSLRRIPYVARTRAPPFAATAALRTFANMTSACRALAQTHYHHALAVLNFGLVPFSTFIPQNSWFGDASTRRARHSGTLLFATLP